MTNFKTLLKTACCLLVIGTIESMCAMNDAEYKTYWAVLILGLVFLPPIYID